MSELEIITEGGVTGFVPGETLRGEVTWAGVSAPGKLELQLLWYTEGKGTRDGQVVASRTIETAGASGRSPFEFTLPGGPYSYSGRLISILWALEVVATPGKEMSRIQIEVGPMKKAVSLDAAMP